MEEENKRSDKEQDEIAELLIELTLRVSTLEQILLNNKIISREDLDNTLLKTMQHLNSKIKK